MSTATSDPCTVDIPSRARRLRRRHVLTTLGATGAMYGTGLGFLLGQTQGDPGPWAVASDVSAAAYGLALVPLVQGVAAELDRATGRRSLARDLGVLAAGLVTAGSTWLVAGAAGLVPDGGRVGLAVQMIGFGALGGWLVLVGARTLRTRRWGRVAGWAAVAAGTGHLVGGAAAALQMFTSPLFALGYSASIVGFVTFLISLLKETR